MDSEKNRDRGHGGTGSEEVLNVTAFRIGTELIDTSDERPCFVSDCDATGPLWVRKRRVGSERYVRLKWDRGRFVRATIRDRAVRRYGLRLVRQAERLGLTYRQAWEAVQL